VGTVRNPIIPGFFPDPSIVRVEDDFYVVNSSFEYFPSIPIWHSRDLVHWQQIGNVIDRPEQGLDLSDVNPSGGVQAVTIRHHAGTFYVTSTRVKKEWPRLDYHFIVTATDIRGPWSECHFIEGAEGIDSSLFFDDDGRSYFLANRQKAGSSDTADAEIWMSEIDLETFTLVGPKQVLWEGTGGIYPEGPRLFKRDGWYYLLIAEGGTLHNHTTSIARSANVTGPYLSSPRNPILTHKHLSREYPIQNVGHADMVQLKDGSWWGVCLGSRPRGGFYDGGNTRYSFGGYYRNLGRETFLFPIQWPADGLSPLFSPVTGRIEESYPGPDLKTSAGQDLACDFTAESLPIKWVTIGEALPGHTELIGDGQLQLRLNQSAESTFFGFRQTSWNFRCSFRVHLDALQEGDTFAFGAYITPAACLSLQITRGEHLQLTIGAASGKQPKFSIPVSDTAVRVELSGHNQDYTFALPELGVSHVLNGREISCDMTDSHTGVMLAFFGVSQHRTTVLLEDFGHTAWETTDALTSD
jgi:alpha-N-arabinofuranosidase